MSTLSAINKIKPQTPISNSIGTSGLSESTLPASVVHTAIATSSSQASKASLTGKAAALSPQPIAIPALILENKALFEALFSRWTLDAAICPLELLLADIFVAIEELEKLLSSEQLTALQQTKHLFCVDAMLGYFSAMAEHYSKTLTLVAQPIFHEKDKPGRADFIHREEWIQNLSKAEEIISVLKHSSSASQVQLRSKKAREKLAKLQAATAQDPQLDAAKAEVVQRLKFLKTLLADQETTYFLILHGSNKLASAIPSVFSLNDSNPEKALEHLTAFVRFLSISFTEGLKQSKLSISSPLFGSLASLLGEFAEAKKASSRLEKIQEIQNLLFSALPKFSNNIRVFKENTRDIAAGRVPQTAFKRRVERTPKEQLSQLLLCSIQCTVMQHLTRDCWTVLEEGVLNYLNIRGYVSTHQIEFQADLCLTFFCAGHLHLVATTIDEDKFSNLEKIPEEKPTALPSFSNLKQNKHFAAILQSTTQAENALLEEIRERCLPFCLEISSYLPVIVSSANNPEDALKAWHATRNKNMTANSALNPVPDWSVLNVQIAIVDLILQESIQQWEALRLKQLDLIEAFFRSCDVDQLQQNGEQWMEEIKSILEKRSANILVYACFPHDVRILLNDFLIPPIPQDQLIDQRLIDYVECKGIHERYQLVLAEALENAQEAEVARIEAGTQKQLQEETLRMLSAPSLQKAAKAKNPSQPPQVSPSKQAASSQSSRSPTTFEPYKIPRGRSGWEIIQDLCRRYGFRIERINGSHAQAYKGNEGVTVPLHDEVKTGTAHHLAARVNEIRQRHSHQ